MTWHGSARAGWGLGTIAAVLLGAAAALALAGMGVAAIVIAVVSTVVVTAFAAHRVTIDDRVIRVRSIVGWTTTIPLDQVESASVSDVNLSGPFESGRSLHGLPFQGWSGRVIRTGEALKLTLTDQRSYTVTPSRSGWCCRRC